jgi:hypothetical protein
MPSKPIWDVVEARISGFLMLIFSRFLFKDIVAVSGIDVVREKALSLSEDD